MPTVTPLSLPVIDWPNFIESSTEALGYNPNKAVTSYKGLLSYHAKFLAVTAAIQSRNNMNALASLRESGGMLFLLSFCFMVEAEPHTFLELNNTSIKTVLSENRTLGIVAGSLADWKAASLILCKQSSSLELRQIFNMVLGTFDKIGLYEIWSDIRRRPLPDKTFFLEHRKV